MFIVKYYLVIAMVCLAAAVAVPNLAISAFFVWCFLSFSLVSCAYVFDIPAIFRKRQDGKIHWWIRWAFIPFLLCVKFYNAWAIKRDKVDPIQQVAPNLYVSRRLFRADLAFLESQNISCILDVTAEFSGLESAMTNQQFHYLTTPVLDHKVPKVSHLVHTLNWIDTQLQQSRSVVVHCALGRGRSVFVVAAYLLSKDPSLSVTEALQKINAVRTSAKLNRFQLDVLKALRQEGVLALESACPLIANPVSGGGKWALCEQQVIRELSQKYPLNIRLTTPDVSAQALAEEALSTGCKELIVSGGDGTVSEVASVVAEQPVSLGIIPLGTANALCHVLYGVASKVSPVDKACDAILSGNHRAIDVAYCNGKLVLLVVGIGFEHSMIDYAQREKKNQSGQFAYLTGFFNAVVDGKKQRFQTQIDDQEATEMDLQSLVVANTSPFSTVLAQGGGMPAPDDGKLHISYLADTPDLGQRLFALSDITATSLGLQKQSQAFDYSVARTVKITSDDPIHYVVDGEAYQADKVAVSIKQKSLTVCIP
ncbi:diacylglycerol kinase family protein [Marinomonas sp.]